MKSAGMLLFLLAYILTIVALVEMRSYLAAAMFSTMVVAEVIRRWE